MTREERKTALHVIKKFSSVWEFDEEEEKAIDNIISELEQESTTKNDLGVQMTNGEKIQTILDIDKDCTEVYGKNGMMTFSVPQDWWFAKYEEPTTKNDLGVDCISRDSAIKALDYDIKSFEFKPGVSKYMDDIAKLLNTIYETQVNNIKALPSVTPQEPILNKIRDQLRSHLRGVEITLEVLVENDPLRPKMEGAKDTLEECLEIIDKAERSEEQTGENT